MYSDPSLIRDRVVKLRFNDQEADLIDAWVNYTGEQKAALLRHMLLEQARIDLGMQSAGPVTLNEGAQLSLLSA